MQSHTQKLFNGTGNILRKAGQHCRNPQFLPLALKRFAINGLGLQRSKFLNESASFHSQVVYNEPPGRMIQLPTLTWLLRKASACLVSRRNCW